MSQCEDSARVSGQGTHMSPLANRHPSASAWVTEDGDIMQGKLTLFSLCHFISTVRVLIGAAADRLNFPKVEPKHCLCSDGILSALLMDSPTGPAS